MAKRQLTRESIQEFLKESDDEGMVTSKSGKKKKKSKRSGSLLDRSKLLTRGATLVTGTLARNFRAEVDHSDFRTRITAFSIGMVTALIVMLVLTVVPGTQLFENTVYDLKMANRPGDLPRSGSLLHVDIDDKSIAAVGRFPWKRSVWAGVVDASKEMGVERVVFDVEFYNQQDIEADVREFARLENWVEQFRSRLEGYGRFANAGLDLLSEDLERAAAGTDAGERQAAAARAKMRLWEIRAGLIQEDPTDPLAKELQQALEDVLVDHDQLLADAVRRAGNVCMPLHFDESDLTKVTRRVEWTAGLFAEVEAAFDSRAKEAGLASISPADLASALTGRKQVLRDGSEAVISAELANLVSQEELSAVRSLYMYRKVHRWYQGKPVELIREHMELYAKNWRRALEERAGVGEVWEQLGPQQVLNTQDQWPKAANTQLQKFYTIYQFRHGAAERATAADGTVSWPVKRRWAVPVSAIEGYDPKRVDLWSARIPNTPRMEQELPHYRDIEMEAAIFQIFAGAAGTGFVSIDPDRDGIIRRIPLATVFEETVTGERFAVLQIGLWSLLDALSVDVTDPECLKIIPGTALEFRADPAVVAHYREFGAVGKLPTTVRPTPRPKAEQQTYRIEIDRRGYMMVNWWGHGNNLYHEVFDHLPVAQLHDVAENGARLRENRAAWDSARPEFARRLLESEYTAGVAKADGTRTVGQTPPEFFNVPFARAFATISRLPVPAAAQREMAGWLTEQARLTRRLLAGDVEGIAPEQLAAFEGIERTAKALADKQRDRFRSFVLTTLKKSPNTADEGLAEVFDAGTAERLKALWGEVQTGFEKPLGSAFHSRLGIDRLKELDDAKKALLTRHTIEGVIALVEPEGKPGPSIEAIRALCKEVYGAMPEELPDEQKAAKAFFTGSGAVGKLLALGPAFRELMDARVHPLTSVELERAQMDNTASGPVLEALKWEVATCVKAGMLKAEDPIVASAAAGDAHALLAWSPPTVVLVARGVRTQRTRLEAAEADISKHRQGMVEQLAPYLQGRTVLMGAAATGLGDLVATPVHGRIPGPTIHSNAYNNLLFGISISHNQLISILITAVLVSLICFACARMPALWTVVAFVGGVIVYGAFALYQFWHHNVALESATNLFALFLPFLAIQVYRYTVEYRAKLKIKAQFGRFLSHEAVEQLQKNPDMLKLGGDEAELCVYFSDIAGFTPISESMTPSRLIDFLNDYMTRTCQGIKDSNGYVDKFIGDACMAIWGKPNIVPDYSARALKTAIRNCQVLADWNRDRKSRGELEVGTRIGLATGPMVAGNMGTEWKLNYTVIGDTVNLAARLEGANKQYGSQIMCNELAYMQAKEIVIAHKMDCIAVKGKKKGVPVYHLLGLVGETDGDIIRGCKIYEEAFELYQQEKWKQALEGFLEAKKLLPGPYLVDMAPADHMIERCELLKDANAEQRMEVLHLKSADAEWDGVWKLTSK